MSSTRPFPENWKKRGHVYIHPKDTTVYPKEITTVNPMEFVVPPPSKDGIVRKWGLEGSTITGECENLYNMSHCPSPYVQFANVLAQRKAKSVTSSEIQEACKNTLRIKISLAQCEEDVWRVFTVPASISLAVLHDQILSAVMGWSRCYHIYAFRDLSDGAALGLTANGAYVDWMWIARNYHVLLEDRNLPLAMLLRQVGDRCEYDYDLGDCWTHRLQVVEVLTPGDRGYNTVSLQAGEGACPPEDSLGLDEYGQGYAGIPCYRHFLSVYKKDPHSCQKAIEMANQAANYKDFPWKRFSPFLFRLQDQQKELAVTLRGRHMLRGPCCFRIQYIEDSSECAFCHNKLRALQRCSQCHEALYCTRDCQVGDWKQHKRACREVVKKKQQKQRDQKV